MLQDNKFKKITALIATVAIVFVVFFSAFYISQHADHDCAGAECSICAVMKACVNNIRSIGTAVATAVVAVLLCFSICKSERFDVTTYSDFSLIAQKIRLNI